MMCKNGKEDNNQVVHVEFCIIQGLEQIKTRQFHIAMEKNALLGISKTLFKDQNRYQWTPIWYVPPTNQIITKATLSGIMK